MILEDLGWLLLHSLWQAVVVCVALRVTLAWLSRARARYWSCWLALAAIVALMCVTVEQDMFRTTVVAAVAPSPPSGIASVGAASSDGIAVLPWVWLAVVLPGLIRLVIAGMGRRQRFYAPAPAWQQLAGDIAGEMRIRTPRVYIAGNVESPATCGVFRPIVLIPESMEDMLSEGERRFVLAHELAHIKRRDAVSLAAQRTLEVVLFYQPAVRWITRQLHVEREYCCDDLAVAFCGDPLGYARTLATLEKLRPAPAQFVPTLGSAGGQLLDRVRRIAERTTPAVRVSPLVSAAAAFFGVTAFAMVQGQPVRLIPALNLPRLTSAAPPPMPVQPTSTAVTPLVITPRAERPDPRPFVPARPLYASLAPAHAELPEPVPVTPLDPPATPPVLAAATPPPPPPEVWICPPADLGWRVVISRRISDPKRIRDQVRRAVIQSLASRRRRIPRPVRTIIVCPRCGPHTTL